MIGKDSPLVVASFLATLAILWDILRLVVKRSAPTMPCRRRSALDGSGVEIDAGPGDDSAHLPGGSDDHAGMLEGMEATATDLEGWGQNLGYPSDYKFIFREKGRKRT